MDKELCIELLIFSLQKPFARTKEVFNVFIIQISDEDTRGSKPALDISAPRVKC
jgi:hypothetical protein